MENLTGTIILEKTTRVYRRTLKDGNSAVVPAASLSTLTLTLYDMATPSTFINGRDHQNVLNANNVTLDSSGVLTWTMQVADTTLLSQTSSVEYRVALFEWYGASVGYGKHEVQFVIQNLVNVT